MEGNNHTTLIAVVAVAASVVDAAAYLVAGVTGVACTQCYRNYV